MYPEEPPVYSRFPKIQIWRRGCALLIDYWVVSLLSSLVGGNTPGVQWDEALLFLILWGGMRVVAVVMNQGQSLGRYALDMKVVDTRFGRTPLLVELFKREGIIGVGALLTKIGLLTLRPGDGAGMLLLLPLAIDCSVAWTEPFLRQAFHDRVASTIVIASRRGYSLDLKLKKWFRLSQRFIQQAVEKRSGRRF